MRSVSVSVTFMILAIVWLSIPAIKSPGLPIFQSYSPSVSPRLPISQSHRHEHFIVCIDPGHPSEVNSGKTIQHGTTETHIDWVVALKLRRNLEGRGFTVAMTKSSEGELVKNKDRGLAGNRAHAGLTVRLHCDASPDTGYALYYPNRQGTTQGKTGPTADIMARSKSAAELVDKGMAAVLAGTLKNGGVRGDSKTLIGSKQGALTGSIFSMVPVVTIEMVVLSNAADAEFIKTEAGQQKMADAIAAGIALCEKARHSALR